jgi:predicted MFS family arabinose efflux permease
LLTEAVAAYGWRVAYRLLAAAVLAAGIVAVIFLPGQHAPNAAKSDTRPSREAYRHILRSRPFLILACAMLLCNLGTIITGLQFAPMLIERGVGATMVGGFLSAYALGVIAGRIAIGLSLDRLPSRYVAAVGMGMPALGFALLAGVPGSVSIALFAVILLGVSQGAEGDIAGYIGAQYFGPHVFGTIFGLVTAVTSLAGFLGSMLSGVLLQGDSSFVPFLLFLAITTALGSGAFLLLPRERGKYDARVPVAPAPTQ